MQIAEFSKSIESRDLMCIIPVNKCTFINGRKGTYRAITKCRAGFLTVYENEANDKMANDYGPANLLTSFKKGSLKTLEFKAEGSNNWLTVFALKGKNVFVIDEDILKGLTVGCVNQYFGNTNLYSQAQYSLVNALSWADLAFVNNPD